MDLALKLKETFKEKITDWFEHSPKRIYVSINKGDLLEVAKYLFSDLRARFITASGVDTPEAIEILYHFALDKLGKVVSLKVMVDKKSSEIESLAPAIPAAEWIEREIYDLLGVKFKNHPNLKRFLLPEDWPEGVYPLRQERKE